jgi:hypothetical protein
MAIYYLEMQPHLFQDAVENAFQKLKEQKETQGPAASAESSSLDLALSKRIQEVKDAEAAVAIEDLMYVCILDKFREIGVSLLPQLGPMHEDLDALKALTEGVHTREAIEMVKEHMLGALGPASMAYGDTVIKMSKLQSAQVYAASIMFGYFLRRVDARYQLSKQMGTLPESRDDAVERLEKLFASAEADQGDVNFTDGDSNAGNEGSDEGDAEYSQEPSSMNKKASLRSYVENFDEETMLATARLFSVEGAALVERQTEALFGDPKELQKQMQDAVGQDAASVEELMKRVQEAVETDRVENVTMTVATQRRLVLEAVAYGCFLRDIETWVSTDYGLLTATSPAS